jgi:hypothetical protein
MPRPYVARIETPSNPMCRRSLVNRPATSIAVSTTVSATGRQQDDAAEREHRNGDREAGTMSHGRSRCRPCQPRPAATTLWRLRCGYCTDVTGD